MTQIRLIITDFLPVRIRDDTFIPLLSEGKMEISYSVFHSNSDVIKQIITFNSFLLNTTAGIILLPFKSVKGNGIKTTVPFFIKTFLYISVKNHYCPIKNRSNAVNPYFY